MIISASRRTDIPALFGEWFTKRLEKGFVMVRNPMNPKSVSKIPLNPEIVDCIVFWTKDPRPFLSKLEYINQLQYKYYFQFTLNSYDKSIEKNIDCKKNIIRTFKELSLLIGKNKVIWRYDPIIITDKFSIGYHLKWFAYLSQQLSGYTERCVVSFVDEYAKIRNNLTEINFMQADKDDRNYLMSHLFKIADENNIKLYTCSESSDYRKYGVLANKCIDDELIENITGYKIRVKRALSQRKYCRCVESRDIGSYNSCSKACIYCYAGDKGKPMGIYDPDSPLLCDHLNGDENISQYKQGRSLRI